MVEKGHSKLPISRFQVCIAIECALVSQSWPSKGNTVHTNSIQCHHNFLLSTESDAMNSQPSDFQRNPAYGHFGPTDSSPAALVSGSCSKNPACNIDAQPSAPQEPTYEVIPSDTDRTPQGAHNVNCNQKCGGKLSSSCRCNAICTLWLQPKSSLRYSLKS